MYYKGLGVTGHESEGLYDEVHLLGQDMTVASHPVGCVIQERLLSPRIYANKEPCLLLLSRRFDSAEPVQYPPYVLSQG